MPEPSWRRRGLPPACVFLAVMTAAFPWTVRSKRRPLLLLWGVVAFAAMVSVAGISSAVAQSSIGIYRDTGGSNCTLSDLSPGIINAYVVVRPGPNGASGVEFSAPKPECFTGTYLIDVEAPGTLVLGNSQTGVAVSLLGCSHAPMHVLTIQYTSLGTTPPCCEYPILPDPTTGAITVVDCTYELEAATGVVSTINPDASCLCIGNSAPLPPQSPVPQDGGLSVGVSQDLAWTVTDIDNNLAEYDLYFGTDPVPPLLAAGLVTPAYEPGQLEPLTQYYWKVVARDAHGLEMTGPVWTFTTRVLNTPPAPPGGPVPADGAKNQLPGVSLEWRTADIDGDTLRFDVYFGTSPAPPLVLANTLQWWYTPGTLAFSTTYYWRVVVRDPAGEDVEGPVWSFVTRPENYAPNVPQGPSPANGATGRPVTLTLSWLATDADGDTLAFDVYLGTSAPPPLVVSDQMEFSYSVTGLEYMTTYYWRIVARDPSNAERSGPTWSFTTRPENFPPAKPSGPSPGHNYTGRPLSQSIGWYCSDADGHALVYDVYFGTESPPPLVVSAQEARTYFGGTLAPLTRYYWRIVARDVMGAETAGPTWSFVTRDNSTPNVSSPAPGNNSTGRAVVTTLSWYASDADGHALTYDVYLGTTVEPDLVAAALAVRTFAPDTLAWATKYYWRVVARDELGAERTGPLWNFTTRLENLPPNTPTAPSPSNGSINRPVTTTLWWYCTEPEGEALTYDVYLGTESPPALAASELASRFHSPGLLAVSTQYYWRIVARDARGAETAGPIWTFHTSSNQAPEEPSAPSPPDDGVSSLTPVLSWSAADPEGQTLLYDVYFGTAPSPPQVRSGLSEPAYAPAPLQSGTRYYWRVVASDGQVGRSGPVWSFVATTPGDVDQDASVTLADAAATLDMYLHGAASGVASAIASGDVDCSGAVTPSDARCIHRHVVNGSCTFCDAAARLAASSSPGVPALSVANLWAEDDTLVVRLTISGVPSLASFGFDVACGEAVRFLRVTRAGATAAFNELSGGAAPGNARVGGYVLDGAPAMTPAAFIDMRFVVPGGRQMLRLDDCVDDLAGAAPLEIVWNGGSVPVLFARFAATPAVEGVEVRWELSGDETAERFTLLRREGDAAGARVAGEGTVTGKTGSYLDTAVEPATTYHYELVVHTGDGNEFRSPVATVTTGSRGLALGQNHPNPFNPTTAIPYTLASGSAPARVRLIILDVAGRVVRTLVDEEQAGGSREAVWDGRDDQGGPVSSGVYFYVLDVGGERRTRKLVLLK